MVAFLVAGTEAALAGPPASLPSAGPASLLSSGPSGRIHPVGLQGIGESLTAGVIVIIAIACVLTFVLSFLAERRTTGRPSFVTTYARRMAARTNSPLWERLPLVVVLAGLAIALVGWRSLNADSALQPFGLDLSIAGLAITMLGGIVAGALAHPPRSVADHAADDVAHPLPAHRVVTRRGRLGAGPIGGPVVALGAALTLLVLPFATVWLAVTGSTATTAIWPHDLVLVGTLACCLGAWLLHGEARRATRAARLNDDAGPAGRGGLLARIDLANVACAATVLLGLSVVADSGMSLAVLGVLGALALVVVRLESSTGAALLAAAGYVLIRLLADALALAFVTPLAPLAWQAVAAAVVIEVLVGAGQRIVTPRPVVPTA